MKTKINHLLGAVLPLLVMFGLTQSAIAAANAADEFVADELLVGFQPGTRGAQADGIRNGLSATRIKAWSEIGAEHWRLPPGLSVAQAIQALAANPNILYVEPNYVIHAVTALPNDPLLGSLWGMHNAGQTGGTPGADMKALEVWQVPPGDGPVVVGVIDTGVDFNHPDLAGRRWVNPGETGLDQRGRDKATNGKDDDRNGYVDDASGWDFINNDNNPMDDHGHGTHVSGTIAGNGNDGIGVIGVAGLNPSVQIMPLKFLGANGSGTDAGAVDAILYASKFLDASGDNVVRLTSNSWGRSGAPSSTMENAILTAGALFVAAAGNGSTNDVHYPAGYSAPNLISVAASDSNDGLASFSNYSPDWVDLAAPGVSILSCLPGNTYASWNGTSMATPHVSGVAALLMSQNPGLSVDDVKAQILSAVDVVPGLADKVATSGRLNAARVMGAPELPPDTTAPGAVADLAAAPVSPHAATLTWTAPGGDGYAGRAYFYDIRYSTSPIDTDAAFQVAGRAQNEPSPQTGGTLESFTVENLADNTTWYFALKTVDEFGNTSPLSNLASAALPLADWWHIRLDWGYGVGNYTSLGVNSQWGWAVVYDDANTGMLMSAFHPPGTGYFNHQTVGAGGIGASLVYSPDETEVRVSHVSGTKLYFANRSTDGVWTSTQLESKDVYAGDTSIANDGSGNPCISYCKTGRNLGLWFAHRNGSTWTTQQIEKSARAYHNQLAIDPAGNPIIVYSADLNRDGSLDALKVAWFNGSGWNISVVDTAPSTFVTVAFDLVTGYPAIACKSGANELRFYGWTGVAWAAPEFVDTGASITGCSLAYAQDGSAFLAYGVTEMRLAIRDANSGQWSVEVMDETTPGGLRNSMRGRPLMTPSGVVYKGPRDPGFMVGPNPEDSSTVRLAWRQTNY